MKKVLISRSFYLLLGVLVFLGQGCAASSQYLKGVSPEGQKVYIGPTDIENTEAFQTYLRSPQAEASKQQYLFQRLKDASKDIQYYHDGVWYNWLETYRAGMWLVRNKYQKGQDTREFLKRYVWRSEAGKLHLVKFPDESVHIGYFILLNELDLLEETLRKTEGK